MISDVITVQALGTRLKIGRSVHIAYSQSVKICNDFARRCKCEPPVELQTVGAGGNPWMLTRHEAFSRHSERSRGILHQNEKSISTRWMPYHIFSGTLMPRRSRPRCNTRAARSDSSRRELRVGSSDLNTGQAS